jgi:putative ABC transport system substrate-binding protein
VSGFGFQVSNFELNYESNMACQCGDLESGEGDPVSNRFIYIALGAVLLGLSFAAEAQQLTKIPRIGFLGASSASALAARIEAFRQGLRELGYVEGKNIVIEWRSAEGKLDRLPALAAELVRLKVDVIVTTGPAPTRPAKEATSTIPIVMAFDNDPVGNGFVASLARPGGEHYWVVHPCPGDKRKTTRGSEGDRS